MSVSKDKRTGHYGYNFMYQGVRYHRNFKDATFEEVAQFETVARSELIKTGYDITKDNKTYTLSELITDFKIYVDNNYTETKNAKRIVDIFYRLVGNKPAEKITINDLEKYRTYRKKDVQNATINREMNNIRRVFSLAKQNHKIKFNPCDDLKKLRIKNPAKRFLQKDEEEKLLNACNPVMKAIVIIALHSGMRSSEIKNLKWADVFLKQDYLIALNTKNGKARKIILTPQMKEALLKLPHIGEYVFMNPTTKKQYTEFKATFRRTVKRAGIPHITFHELRHTAASRLNEIGVDLITIQEYLDHADARTTQRYIHNPKKNITDAVKRLSEY